MKERLAAMGFRQAALLAAAVAVGSRAYLAAWHMSASGDGRVYRTVARNLLDNGCISLSDPATARCLAHWGGNQPPGYPAFIAGVWALFGDSLSAIGIATGLVTALAIVRAMYAMRALGLPGEAMLAGGLLLALSPAHVGWSSHVLTEALAVATTIWAMAEIALCLARGRLQVLPLSLSLLCAILVRYDALVLGVPVGLTVLMLRPLGRSLARAAMVLVLVFTPLTLWVVHGLSQGLPLPVGRYLSSEEMQPKPMGYTRWVHAWMYNQYDIKDALWAVAKHEYGSIRIPGRAYLNAAERRRAEALLARLRGYEGRPFPAEVDAGFDALYAAHVAAEPFSAKLFRLSARLAWLWLDPYTSLGWPALKDEVRDRLAAAVATHDPSRIAATVGAALLADPVPVLGKLLNTAYRYALVVIAACAFVLALRWGSTPVRRFVAVAVTYAIVRSAALAIMGYCESRYVAEAIPGLEMTFVMGLWAWLGRPRPARA